MNESDVQAGVLIVASRLGVHLWRNNSGVFINPNGQPVRFGLGNTSKKLNSVFKTPDLIGMDDRGCFIGVECKKSGWKYTGNRHEIAQRNCLNLINSNGGLGVFIYDPELFRHTYTLYKTGKFNANYSP